MNERLFLKSSKKLKKRHEQIFHKRRNTVNKVWKGTIINNQENEH